MRCVLISSRQTVLQDVFGCRSSHLFAMRQPCKCSLLVSHELISSGMLNNSF